MGVLRSAKFQQFSAEFIEEHCDEFEDTEENQLSWMTRHMEYVELAEALIEADLRKSGRVHEILDALPSFLASAEVMEMDTEVASTLDFILNLTNFEDFKDTMIARKTLRNIEELERLEGELQAGRCYSRRSYA